jgi:hypothetical protein
MIPIHSAGVSAPDVAVSGKFLAFGSIRKGKTRTDLQVKTAQVSVRCQHVLSFRNRCSRQAHCRSHGVAAGTFP